MSADLRRLTSRKFAVAMASIIATTGLGAVGKMTGDVATVFLAVNAGYHLANAYVTGKGPSK